MTGGLFVVAGPSGVGKGTVLRRLFERDNRLFFSVSATTRRPREKEVHGINYVFMDRPEFEKLIAQGAFLEYVEYVDNYYGTLLAPIEEQLSAGRDVFLEIDTVGALHIREIRPEAILIFLAPPSFEELAHRLSDRGTESPEKVEKRLKKAKTEYEKAPMFDYIVVNSEVETAVLEIEAIVLSEKCKVKNRKYLIEV